MLKARNFIGLSIAGVFEAADVKKNIRSISCMFLIFFNWVLDYSKNSRYDVAPDKCK